MKKKIKIRNVLLLVGVNVFLIVSLEILCWIIVPKDKNAINFESYPDYIYRMPPNHSWRGEIYPDEVTTDAFFVSYRTNAHGFRGPEFQKKKSPGTSRVLCMGDSHTYGEGVEESQTYSGRLEMLLNQAAGGPRFEVINLGVSGYSSCQGLLLLKKEALNLEPDYVVIAYGSNDYYNELLGPYRDLTDREVLELLNRSEKLPSSIMEIVKKTHLYHGLKKGIFYLLSRIRRPAENGDLRRVPVGEYRENLARFREFADREGFVVIFLNIGNFGNAYDRAMREVAEEQDVAFLHAVEIFRKRLPAIRSGNEYEKMLAPYREMLGETLNKELYDEGALYYTVDGSHPNAVGHLIIAEELARIILQREGIQPPDGLLPRVP